MYGAIIVMVPVQPVHAPFCTLVGVSVSVMVFEYEITPVEVVQPVTFSVAVPLYPVPELCSVMENDAFWYVPAGPMDIIIVIAGQLLGLQAGAALHVSSQW